MSRGGIHSLSGRLSGRFGLPLRILALACVALGACICSSSRPQVSRSDQPPPEHPQISTSAPKGQLEFVSAGSSRAELRGSTTVGSWTSESADIHAQVVLRAEVNALDALFDQIQSRTQPPTLDLPVQGPVIAEVFVPVKSLRGDSAGMDNDMQKALKAAQYPSIEYDFQHVEQATVQRNPSNQQAGLKLRIRGKLRMAGAERAIAMDMTVYRSSPQHFHAQAQTTLLMSDFGVTPPVALLGLIKAGNKVSVLFDLQLAVKDNPSRPSPSAP